VVTVVRFRYSQKRRKQPTRCNNFRILIFIDIFESALHASGNKLAHLQEHFLTVNTVLLYIYRTVILPVVLYGCETWSLTLRKERKLRV